VSSTCHALLMALLLFGVVPGVDAAASDEPDGQQVTGRQLRAALDERTSITVTGSNLSSILSQISQDARIAVLLDRRIDPGTPLHTETGFAPRLQVLKKILPAEPEMDVQVSDRVVLIGPAASVRQFPVLLDWNDRAVREAGSQLTASELRRLAAPQPVQIPKLSEPRLLVTSSLDGNGLTLSNPEMIPHDVWGAVDLPDLPLPELLTVILIQFDLALQAGSRPGELTVTGVESLPAFDRRYVVGRKLRQRAQEEIDRLASGLDVRWSGGTATVSASVDQHAMLELLLAQLRNGTTGGGDPDFIPITQRTFTLKVERASVELLVRSFRQQGIPIQIEGESDPSVQALMQRPVELDVVTEPADSFFQKAFGEAFSSVVVEDDRVLLRP